MRCPQCGHENAVEMKFCGECGTRLAVVCRECGARNAPAQKFCGERGARLESDASSRQLPSPDTYTPKHLAEKILTSKAVLEGERKQVTVLFADLKGSMELLADRDPEEARKILDPVLERMMDAVHHYEGTVNQVMGDGIMALFGAPLAHEDHAVRACYAALQMQGSVKRYAEEVRRAHAAVVKIRVGLNSGEVVVRAIGSDLRMDYTAVGQTTHLAARMEQIADPGAIVITPDTLALAEGYVEVKSLGPIPVKGLADPIEIFELTAAGHARTRLQAAALRGLTRFVGRDAEVEHLSRVLGRAGAGRGQVVAVVGEAGVGKSRLTYEFTHSHRVQDWLILEASSVSYGKATSYLPVINLLKGYFKIGDRDDHREIRAKVLGRVLGLDRALEPALPPLLALLDVPVEDPAWQTLDALQRRQHTLDAAKHLLLRESQAQPLLVVFEDLHWIDGQTQALLDGLVESLGSARLLLLVSYRTEYEHRWANKTAYSQLRLDSLPVESTQELLAALLGPDEGLAPLAQMLVKRGNPFFLEETVRTLVETGALVGERGAYRLTRPVDALRVPATVQTILAARIDRLPAEEKLLLQAASVIGKDVPYTLLAAIAEQPEADLRLGLAHLQDAAFLYETQLFPDLEFTFRHALTHEVTYSGLLQERRRLLHARVVQAIEQFHAGRLEEEVERLGHHALRGEIWEKAADYLYRAGAKAFGRSALREASVRYDQAKSALDHLPQTDEIRARSIDIRIEHRNALMQIGDYRRVKEILLEARARAEALGDQRRLGQTYSLLANFYMNTGDLDAALDSGRQALTIAEALGDFGLSVMVSLHLGWVHCVAGDYQRAEQLLTRHLPALTGDLAKEHFGLAGPASVLLRSVAGLAQAELGAFAQGIPSAREGVRLAEHRGRALDRGYASRGLATLYLHQGEIAQGMVIAERSLELAEMNGIPTFIPWFASQLAYASAVAGKLDRVPGLTEQVNVSLSLSSHAVWIHSQARIWSGEAMLLAGRIDEASRLARSALDDTTRNGQRGHRAWATWLLGEIAMTGGPDHVQRATDHYLQALTEATGLGMRPLVAHCHLGLGKLCRRRGNTAQAQEQLTIATSMYREMNMTYWLEHADAQMRQLG
jgi:class 3 adenylate cyclase/tetratricopeptide (TPR) repeat protein